MTHPINENARRLFISLGGLVGLDAIKDVLRSNAVQQHVDGAYIPHSMLLELGSEVCHDLLRAHVPGPRGRLRIAIGVGAPPDLPEIKGFLRMLLSVVRTLRPEAILVNAPIGWRWARSLKAELTRTFPDLGSVLYSCPTELDARTEYQDFDTGKHHLFLNLWPDDDPRPNEIRDVIAPNLGTILEAGHDQTPHTFVLYPDVVAKRTSNDLDRILGYSRRQIDDIQRGHICGRID